MNPAELFGRALERLGREFPDAPPVIIGGVALILHGSDRLTKDIDVAFQDLYALLSVMYALGFKAISRAERDKNGRLANVVLFPDRNSAFEKSLGRKAMVFIEPESQARFDVWFVSPVPYRQLLANSVLENFEGIIVRIASENDLIELKRIALKDNPNRASDVVDIAFLEEKLRLKSQKQFP